VERIEKVLDDSWLQVARLSSNEKSKAHSIVSKGGLAQASRVHRLGQLSQPLSSWMTGRHSHLLGLWGLRSLELRECCSTRFLSQISWLRIAVNPTENFAW
jgi:hypothetical protein